MINTPFCSSSFLSQLYRNKLTCKGRIQLSGLQTAGNIMNESMKLGTLNV